VVELGTGAAAEVVTTPVLLKADIEVEELVIARVAAGAEAVVEVRQEDAVESVVEDVDEDSRTTHRRHHPTQPLRLPTLKVPYQVYFLVPPKVAFYTPS
jgi:hypothetical protein